MARSQLRKLERIINPYTLQIKVVYFVSGDSPESGNGSRAIDSSVFQKKNESALHFIKFWKKNPRCR